MAEEDFAYREIHGVVPQLDWVNYKQPIDNLTVPNVVYSAYADLRTTKTSTNAKKLIKGAGGLALGLIGIGGGLSFAASSGTMGDGLGSVSEAIVEKQMESEINVGVVNAIKEAEEMAWPLLYLLRSFKPADGFLGDIVFKDGACDDFHTGNGHQIFENGDYFEGYFRDGEIAIGIYIFANGARYYGRFQNNKFDDMGLILYPDGTYYFGGFRNGVYDDWGYRLYSDGAYSGEFKWGQRTKGWLRTQDRCFFGQFEDDQPVR